MSAAVAGATLNIPIRATYKIINGEAVKVDEERANIPTDTLAQIFMRGFGVSVTDKITEAGGGVLT